MCFSSNIYHPRRSNLAPEGYILTPYEKALDQMPFVFGYQHQLPNFPQDLPQVLQQERYPAAFIRRCSENLAKRDFVRPTKHLQRLREMRIDAQVVPVWRPSGRVDFMSPNTAK